MTTVVNSFSWFNLAINSMVAKPLAGSRLAKGSSNRTMGDSSIKTPPIETRCFCPPDKDCGARSKRSTRSSALAQAATLDTMLAWSTWSFSKAKARSSATVRPTNWASVSCRTVPTLSDKSKMDLLAESAPLIKT